MAKDGKHKGGKDVSGVPKSKDPAPQPQGEDTAAPAKESAAAETGPAPEAVGNGDTASRKTDKLPARPAKPELSKEAQTALEAVDFRVKELRAINRKEGAISRRLVNVPGVKETLQARGWFVGESGDPLNYHVKFAK